MNEDRVPEGKMRHVADEVERVAKAILPNVEFPEGLFSLLLERGRTQEWIEKLKANCSVYLNAKGQRKRETTKMELLRSLLASLIGVVDVDKFTLPQTKSDNDKTRIQLAVEQIRELSGPELRSALEQAELPASKIRRIVEFIDSQRTLLVDLAGIVDDACRTGQRRALAELLAGRSIPSIERLRRLVGQLKGVEIRDSQTKWKLVRRLKNLAALGEAEFTYNGSRVKSLSLNRSGRGFGNYDVRTDDGDQYRLSLFPPLGVDATHSRDGS